MPSAKDVAKEAKKAKDKKPAVSKMPAKKAPPPSKLSTEYVQDSDSDANSTSDDGSLPDNPAAAKAKASGKAKNAVADSSSSGSGSGSESESGSESSANESSSEEDEDEDEDGSSEEEEEETNSPVVSKPKQSSTQSSTKAVTLQEPAPYSPPTGFKSASVNGTTKSSQLFKESNLQGKQIWYITAPASAPLSSIEELSLLDIKEHRKVLSHKGDNYGFFEDESEATAITKVLVPSSSDDGYRSAKTPVNKILHLQQIVQPPSLPQITTPAKKPVRQQPRGLKMRFRPIGFSNGDMGRIGSSSSSEGESSDQEMQDAPAAKFRKPESLSATESSDGSEDDDSSSHAKKTKAPPKSSKSKAPAVESSKKTDGSLKRKSSEGGDKKSKHSSSTSTNATDDRRLKRIKRKQIKSQKTINSQSVPTEARNTDSMMLPPRARTSLTPIPPPTSKIANSKASIVPPSHLLNRITPIPPPISTQISSQSSHVSLSPSNPRTAVSEAISKDYSHLDEQIRAIDPGLTRKERRNEIKRLKRSESSYDSKDKRRGSVPSSADMVVGPVKNTSISPPPSSKPVPSSSTPSNPKEKEEKEEKEDKDKKKEEKKARKEKKLRRKEGKMANEVLDKGNETQNFSPPHSTSAILPPRHMSKR